MKTERLILLFGIFVVFASCQIHHGNFLKRKFLDLEKMNDNEIVETNNRREIYFEDLNSNSNFEECESSECTTNIGPEDIQSSDVKITYDEIEQTSFTQKCNTEKSENVIHQQQIINTLNPSDPTKKDNPKTSDQLFKLAALIFLLGLLLILVAIVGLFKSKMSEAAGFVYFMLGLISLILSAIYAIVGTNKINPDQPRQRNIKRRDTLLFFGIFFVALAMLFISGKV